MLVDRGIKQILWNVGSTSVWCTRRFCSSSLSGNNQLGSKQGRHYIMISHERSTHGGDWSVNYVCVSEDRGILVGFSEHPYCRDTLQVLFIKEFSCTVDWGGYGGLVVFPQWKTNAYKLSISTAWRVDIWKADFNRWPLFISGFSITQHGSLHWGAWNS